MDPTTQEFVRGKDRFRLTPIEFRLLHLLISNHNKVVRSEVIVDRIWGRRRSQRRRLAQGSYPAPARKGRDNPSLPDLIITVPGVGYMVRVVENR